MLSLNVTKEILKKWDAPVQHYYALHLGGFSEDIEVVNFEIEELVMDKNMGTLYRCELKLMAKSGTEISHVTNRENCLAAIDDSFAKAKRMMQRRLKGLIVDALPLTGVSNQAKQIN